MKHSSKIPISQSVGRTGRHDAVRPAMPGVHGPVSHALLQTVIDAFPSAVMVVDRNHRIVLANRKACEHADGRNPVQEGLACHQIFHQSGIPCSGEDEPCPVKTVVENKKAVTITHHHTDPGGLDQIVEINAAPIFDDESRVSLVVEAYNDITDRVRFEEALVESEEKFRYSFDQSPVGAAILSLDGMIRRVNTELCRFIGYTAEELDGTPLDRFVHHEDAGTDAIEASELADGRIANYQVDKRFVRKDGRIVWGRVSVSILRDSKGQPVHLFPLVEDITERKRVAQYQEMVSRVLEELNKPVSKGLLPVRFADLIKDCTGITSVGLLLSGEGPLPFSWIRGSMTPADVSGRCLCGDGTSGEGAGGNGCDSLDCMCSDLIAGRIERTHPAFTDAGSFWTNHLADFLEESTEDLGDAFLKNLDGLRAFRSVALVPVRTADSVIGLLRLCDAKSGFFSPMVIRFFEQLGTSIGMAITQNRAEEKLQWKLKLMRSLADLSQLLISPTASLPEIGRKVLDSARSLTRSEHGYVAAIDGETGARLAVWHSSMVEADGQGEFHDLRKRALNERQAFFTNAPDKAEPASRRSEGRAAIINFLSAPAIVSDTLLGQVSLANSAQEYTRRDLEAVRMLTELFALGIRRKQNDEALEEARQRLEERVAERTAAVEERAAQLRILAAELVTTEQRERRRIAHILHDHLQQLLVGARMNIDIIRREYKGDASLEQSLRSVEEMLHTTIETTRSLQVDLYPSILYAGGLVEVIEWLCGWMGDKQGLAVDLSVEGEVPPVSEEIRVLLFNSVRELLFNVVKHCGTCKARSRVRFDRDRGIAIEIEDRGPGFEIEEGLRSGSLTGGFGLLSVRERMRSAGGTLEIDSERGRGTRATLLVPPECIGAGNTPPSVPPGAASPERGSDVPDTIARACRESDSIRVVLVDDHEIFRLGLVELFDNVEDIEIAGTAADGDSALKLVREIRPDVVIMDVAMPGGGGIDTTRRITAELPNVHIVGFSSHRENEIEKAMINAGALCHLDKTSSFERLTAAIRSCAATSGEHGTMDEEKNGEP